MKVEDAYRLQRYNQKALNEYEQRLKGIQQKPLSAFEIYGFDVKDESDSDEPDEEDGEDSEVVYQVFNPSGVKVRSFLPQN